MTRRFLGLAFAPLVAVHLFIGALVALKAPFPTKVDERDHFSYARHIAETGQLWPDFRNVRLVDGNDVHRLSDETTQLSHPPVYYIALSPLTGDVTSSPLASVTRMRLANLLISALAVVAALVFGMRAFYDPFERLMFSALVTLCPIANVLAGMINNDNLALLAGAVAFLGMIEAHARRVTPRSAGLIASGLALAGLAKLTAFVGLAGMMAFFCLLTDDGLRLRRWMGFPCFLAIAFGAAIGASPYFANLVHYGGLLYVRPAAAFLEQSMEPLSPMAFLINAAARLATSWPGFPPIDPIERLTLPVLVAFAVLGGVASTRRLFHGDALAPAAAIGAAAVAAALATFMINVAYLFWRRGGVGGDLDVYFRFFLPLWPGVAASVVLGLREFGGAWRIAVGVALFALLIYGSIGQLAFAALS